MGRRVFPAARSLPARQHRSPASQRLRGPRPRLMCQASRPVTPWPSAAAWRSASGSRRALVRARTSCQEPTPAPRRLRPDGCAPTAMAPPTAGSPTAESADGWVARRLGAPAAGRPTAGRPTAARPPAERTAARRTAARSVSGWRSASACRPALVRGPTGCRGSRPAPRTARTRMAGLSMDGWPTAGRRSAAGPVSEWPTAARSVSGWRSASACRPAPVQGPTGCPGLMPAALKAELPRDARRTAGSSACGWRSASACRRAPVRAPTGCRGSTAAPPIPPNRTGARPVSARPGCGSGPRAWAWLAVGESNRYRLYSFIRAIRFAP